MSDQLPAPPATLTALQPGDTRTIAAGTRLARIYAAGGTHPRTWNEQRSWGPTANRFDHHPPPPGDHTDAAISYWAAPGDITPTASNPLTATLAEVFATTRTIDTTEGAPHFVLAALARNITVLDVTDTTWVTRNHGNAAISSGDRATARAWARAIHTAYPTLDGIWYQTSNCPPARSIALNERGADAFAAHPARHWALNDPSIRHLIDNAADTLGYDVV